jgi:hypothetical protein
MRMDKTNKITTVLKVVVTGEFYDDEATEETLRYVVEQDLEDVGLDVDVALLKEHEAVKPNIRTETITVFDVDDELDAYIAECGNCGRSLIMPCSPEVYNYCPKCGRKVKW